MAEPRICPLCLGAPQTMEHDGTTFACPSCSLSGDAACMDDLERRLIEHGLASSRAIAGKLARRGILDEAEWLLREANLASIHFSRSFPRTRSTRPDHCSVAGHTPERMQFDRQPLGQGDTLAAALANLGTEAGRVGLGPRAIARLDAPQAIDALPDWWDAQRRAEGKEPGLCAAELRNALAVEARSERLQRTHDLHLMMDEVEKALRALGADDYAPDVHLWSSHVVIECEHDSAQETSLAEAYAKLAEARNG